MVAAPAAGVGVAALDRVAGLPDRVDQRLGAHLQAQALIVDLQDRLAIVGLGVGNVQVKFEAAGSQQRRVDRLDEVGGPDHEHHLVAAKPVHLGQQLVDHRVLDARSGVGPARRGERVELVEHDQRGRALPGVATMVLQPIARPRPRPHTSTRALTRTLTRRDLPG